MGLQRVIEALDPVSCALHRIVKGRRPPVHAGGDAVVIRAQQGCAYACPAQVVGIAQRRFGVKAPCVGISIKEYVFHGSFMLPFPRKSPFAPFSPGTAGYRPSPSPAGLPRAARARARENLGARAVRFDSVLSSPDSKQNSAASLCSCAMGKTDRYCGAAESVL